MLKSRIQAEIGKIQKETLQKVYEKACAHFNIYIQIVAISPMLF